MRTRLALRWQGGLMFVAILEDVAALVVGYLIGVFLAEVFRL